MDYNKFKTLLTDEQETSFPENIEIEISEDDAEDLKTSLQTTLQTSLQKHINNLAIFEIEDDFKENLFFHYHLNNENGGSYFKFLTKKKFIYLNRFTQCEKNLELLKHSQRLNDERHWELQNRIPKTIQHIFRQYIFPIFFQYSNKIKDLIESKEKEIAQKKIKLLEIMNEEINIEKEKLNLLRFNIPSTESTIPKTETPELDFSDNSDKVKLIMLEKLGIIEYIKKIQTKPDTISHTSEILSAITGIETKTLNSYLYPMLRPCRDDDDKNSPYKNPENLEKAERELIKLKIKNIDANR